MHDKIGRQASRPMKAATLMIVTMSLTGCAISDKFGTRLVTFNEQMQRSRQTVILHNIVRAGYDEPLQFSDLTTLSATSTAQVGLGTVLPLLGTRANGARLFQVNPSLQANGGPTVSVANLNNQEFFSGITTPLSIDTVANYVSNGATRRSILFLTVAAIDYDLNGQHYHFEADPNDPDQFQRFQSALLNMITKNLTFERKETADYVGPALTSKEVFGKSVLQELLKAPADAKAPALKRYSMTDASAVASLSAEDRKHLANDTVFYKLTSSNAKTRPCFVGAGSYFGSPSDPVSAASLGIVIGRKDGKDIRIDIGPDYLCGAPPTADAPGVKKLTFTFRSVRGIFGLLGSMARKELEKGEPELFDFPSGNGYPYRVFGVTRVAGETTAIPDGRSVAITSIGKGDMSATTIQLLSELLALHSSAKNLPTPSVIPFFTP